MENEGATYTSSNVLALAYEDFTFNEVINSVIPEDAESVTAFETIGHIAHVNLRAHLEEYKFVIGRYLKIMLKNIFSFSRNN